MRNLESKNNIMKILVIGSAGMLGHVITVFLRNSGYSVMDVSRNRKINSETALMNVVDIGALDRLIEKEFDVIINCAALLVQASEQYKADAIRINAWFPHELEEKFKNTKTRIIHVSSSGVFSGENGPYLEESVQAPGSFYGRTKSLGEINNTKDLTVRVDVVGPNLFEDGLGLFNWLVKQSGEVLGYNQTFFNGITTLEFAKFLEYVIHNPISGIYHLGASETISKGNFLNLVKDVFRLNEITIKEKNNSKSDHTLLSSRKDINYQPKNYLCMLEELKEWMFENAYLYQHYDFLYKEK